MIPYPPDGRRTMSGIAAHGALRPDHKAAQRRSRANVQVQAKSSRSELSGEYHPLDRCSNLEHSWRNALV
jgi:hypothetical protein